MKRHSPPSGLSSPQHYWAVMVELSDARFSVADIHGRQNGASYGTVKKYVSACVEQGAIIKVAERLGIAGRMIALYRVVDRRMPAPIQRRPDFADDRGRRAQQLWTAMRALRSFTVIELAVAASTDTVQISARRAREFVKALEKAGYVAELGSRRLVGQTAHWRLLPNRNTGPLAPAITKAGLVDRNLSGAVNLNRSRRAA
ncbi:MAG: hypothetical protein HEQ16_05175 [Bosea sp.]|jgi:hypothetical protein|nr:hypothetical protein [Bosea sp. (in: a-proteobacteria)]